MAVKTLLEHSVTPRRIFSPSPRQMSGDGQGERGPPLRPWWNPWRLMRLFDHERNQWYCSAWQRFAPQRNSLVNSELPPQLGLIVGAGVYNHHSASTPWDNLGVDAGCFDWLSHIHRAREKGLESLQGRDHFTAEQLDGSHSRLVRHLASLRFQ